MCLLLDCIIKTISFQLFEQKMNNLEKIRQSKVNPDVKNEINIPGDQNNKNNWYGIAI